MRRAGGREIIAIEACDGEFLMNRSVLLSAVLALGLFTAMGVAAQTGAAPQSPGSQAGTDFDGSYAGLQRYIDSSGELRSATGRTSRCTVPSSTPPILTVEDGVASMR